MSEGTIMREKTYRKPNMASLNGSWGKRIIEIMNNTPKPDLSNLKREDDEFEAKVLEKRKDEK